MARRMSMAGRAELLEAVGTRYRGAARLERSRILDEFAAVTGYHRKHAIRLLSGSGNREEVGCSQGGAASNRSVFHRWIVSHRVV